MKFKQVLLIIAISSLSAVASVWAYNNIFNKEAVVLQGQNNMPVNYAGFFDNSGGTGDPVDFSKAASASVPAVVHIKTKIPAQRVSNDLPNQRRGGGFFDDWFDDFFGPQIIPEQRASGSGVLISQDGYIVTNNHVISNGKDGIADEILVTLHSHKTYKAKVIGRDPSSDIAVLKIDGSNFPFMLYGNSDNVLVGQWILAVGYPLTLETTVTAGIVSAKGRTIGINSRQSESPIESFIQTDAAVNQGNSGGALINTNGELIGINSAILAPTGTYAGYSFAIPVNIVKKIVNDIVQYGDVQRGYLGISYPSRDLTENEKKQYGLSDNDGVYVSGVSPDGGAFAAGIKKGDVITKVNNANVSSGLEMSAQIASMKPGDKVAINYRRDGKDLSTTITLRKKPGNFESLVTTSINEKLGATLVTLDAAKAKQFGVQGGVVVTNIKEGGLIGKTRMAEGFIITSVNGRDIKNIEDLGNMLTRTGGNIRLEGTYPDSDGIYTYPLNLNE
jgi:serine protease Do